MKKKHIYAIGFLALLCSTSLVSFAQQGANITLRDFELWSAAKVKYKATEKLTLGLEQQLRLKNDASQVDQYFTEFDLKKQVSNSIHYGIGLRYVRDNDNQGEVQGYENYFRYNIDLGYRHKVQQFKLNYRLRFQRKNELGVTKAQGDIANNHLRFKVEANYNIKKWKLDPEVSTEIFYNLANGENFNKFRFTAGTQYKLKRVGSIGLFYRIERELQSSYPQTTYIAGFKYTYTIKRKKQDD